MSPFDFLNSINYTKEWVFEGEDSERDYIPFVVNRTLSYTPDAVMWANEMNRADIPKEWQYAFLFHVLPKRKRYAKWEKKFVVGEDVALIQEAYKYSVQKATEALALLSSEEIDAIRTEMNRGSPCKT